MKELQDKVKELLQNKDVDLPIGLSLTLPAAIT
jgi:hypothetical protein